ncbi:MAG TPA: peptidoglycan-binding domain-containing protein [Burkholderiales bacterium]|jgi:peptidoglycan hydrolase-like protein with peptidoglycan-binding domain
MMKLTHAAFAGITAVAFSQAALANQSMQHQQGAQSEAQAQQAQSDETVRKAQETLSAKGRDLQADGKLGPKTQAALRDFQQQEGISPSGQLDQETLAALGVDEGASGGGSTSSPASSSSPTSGPSGDAPASQSD